MDESGGSLSVGAQNILEAAEKCFAEHGFHGVSMQDIAKAAGVSKANVYHHFHSKDELYLAVLKYALQEMNELVHNLSHIESSPLEQFSHYSREHLKQLNLKPDIARLVLRELLDASSSRCRDLAQQVFNVQYELLKNMMIKAQQSGHVRQDLSPEHMAVALGGLNTFLFQIWPVLMHFPDAAFADQSASGEILFELLLNGLLSRGDQV